MVTTAGQIMGISCYDHIIIGNGSYYSYLEKSKKEVNVVNTEEGAELG